MTDKTDKKRAKVKAIDGGVIHADFTDPNHITPKLVLEEVGKIDLTTIVVMGYDSNGYEYFSSSTDSLPELYWLADRFKQVLLEAHDGIEE